MNITYCRIDKKFNILGDQDDGSLKEVGVKIKRVE